MGKVEIRELTEREVGGVVELVQRLEEDAMPCSYWGLDEDGVRALIGDVDKRTVVALVEGEVAGVGTLARGRDYQRHLAELSAAVHPQHRRSGLAQVMVEFLEEIAGQEGVELLKGLVQKENLASRRLCEKLGYEHKATLYGEFKSPRFGEIDDCVYYKRLAGG